MSQSADHYTFLGVQMNASATDIAAAIQRRMEQADALYATAPAQADAIRRHVGQARQDLLTDPQRRAAYNQWITASGQASAAGDATIVAPLGTPAQTPRYTASMPVEPTPAPRSSMRWALPAILAALILGAGVTFAATRLFNHNSSPSAVNPTAVPTAASTETRAAPTPTSPAPTVAPTSGPTTAPTSAPADPTKHDPGVIKANGYDPSQSYASTSDGSGGTLYAWIGTCAGSADGHCQKVFFFDGTRYLGTDTLNSSSQINSVQATGPATIAVTYANYRPSDPLCCPSGPPVTITYAWNGHKLTPSGTPPGHKP